MSVQDESLQQSPVTKMPTDFGIFYPIGHIVAVFPNFEDAVRVQRDLMTGGYEPDDCVLYKSEDVVASAKRNLDDNTGWLSRLGKSDELVKKHLDAAKQGSAFAVIYAPSETDAERAMNVIRRVPFEFAHRYRRFAIQTMT